MSKMCPHCGVKYQNSATKCLICKIELPENHGHKKMKKLVFSGIIGIVLVGIAITLVSMLTGPKAAVRRIVEGFKQNDPQAIMAMLPDFVLESDKIDRRELELEMTTDSLTLSKYIFSYNIEEVKDPTSQECEKLMENFRYIAGEDFDDREIKDIKIIWVNYKGDIPGFWPSHATRFTMIKYQGRWYWWPETVNR